MTIVYKKNVAVFEEIAGVEEAEGLLEWLHKYPKGKINLAACTHLHPANLQVMMAARCAIHVAPTDKELTSWIDSALRPA